MVDTRPTDSDDQPTQVYIGLILRKFIDLVSYSKTFNSSGVAREGGGLLEGHAHPQSTTLQKFKRIKYGNVQKSTQFSGSYFKGGSRGREETGRGRQGEGWGEKGRGR